MSILDDEEIVLNDQFTILNYKAELISARCSYKFFKDFADKNILKESENDDFYISFEHEACYEENKIKNVGMWMSEYFDELKVKNIYLYNIGANVYNILYNFSRIPTGSVIIFNELSKTSPKTFKDIIQILKEWENSGTLCYKDLFDRWPDLGEDLKDVRLERKDFKFIFLDTEKRPNPEYVRLPNLNLYGEFFIDSSSLEFMNKIQEVFDIDIHKGLK